MQPRFIFRYGKLLAAIAVALCGFGLTPIGRVHAAATIYVPTDYPTIQAAINAAANGDTIVVSPGTYSENINFLGKAITVVSDLGPDSTIIDGGNTGIVVMFNHSEGLGSVLQGFTIQHGRSQLDGGGIYIASASPTITDNVITNNIALTGGGGIVVFSGSPLVMNNTITNNSTVYSGGSGGGIYLGGAGVAQIIGNTISGNRAYWGGGINMFNAGTPTIQNNIIQNNTASSEGGGIRLVDQSDAAIVQNLVTGNQASTGGGMYLSTPSGTRGPWLTNNTLAENFGLSAIYAVGFFSQTQYFNNIVAASGQNAVECNLFYSTVQPRFDHNDFYSATNAGVTGCTDVIGTNGNISEDPLFMSATDFSLQAGSPAINAGNNDAPNLPSTDLAGNPRIVGGVVDIGAYQFQGAPASRRVR